MQTVISARTLPIAASCNGRSITARPAPCCTPYVACAAGGRGMLSGALSAPRCSPAALKLGSSQTGWLARGRPCGSRRSPRGSSTVMAASSPDIKDRALAALPYLVPLFDGIRYGRFALVQFPFIYTILSPLDPLLRLYTGIPFASLVVFFAIYLGIINNRQLPRYVRFNAMQAILLDIILILPGLFENIFRPPTSGFGFQLYVNAYNSVFFFVLACWAIGTISCILGKVPRLPIVGDAADQQVQ